MNPTFARTFRRVAVVHVAVVGLFILGSLASLLVPRRRPAAIPVEFLVAAPAEPAPRAVTPPPARATPAPAEPRPTRTPIRKSTQRAVRKVGADAEPVLTREEIRRLFDDGAQPSDRTVIPAEEQRCFGVIRRVLYGAWQPPSPAEAGDAVAEVSLRLLPGGGIGGWRIVKPSGNAVLDASVEAALRLVRTIPNLSVEFVRSHRDVTISFQVEQ